MSKINDYYIHEKQKELEFSEAEREYLEKNYIKPVIRRKRDFDNLFTLSRIEQLRENIGPFDSL